MSLPPPSRKRVMDVLDYDPETGVFRRKIQTAPKAKVGRVAGTLNSAGYRLIRIDARRHYAHRLAWLILYDEWPDHDIDHRDRNKDNNSQANLRRATRSENISNQGRRKDAAEFRGVRPPRRGARWAACLQTPGGQLHLGTFETAEAAARAWDRECIKRRGEFAVTNFPREDYL